MLKFTHITLIGAAIVLLLSCHSKSKSTTSTVSKPKPKTDVSKPVSSSKMKNVATVLGVSESEIKGEKLYEFIADWYGTPYKYGGCDKKGTDCSCLTINLYSQVYKKSLPRSADDMMKACDKLSSSKVNEGELVFFKIESKQVTHVGVYLKNNKFIHASTKKGVMISDLGEPYFKKYFYTFGKFR